MREIKFRAWNKRFKTMDFGGGDLLLRINKEDFSEPMQFTGLTDKNVKEIYERDKLKDFATDIVVTVEFVGGSFCVIGYEKFAVDLLEYLENSSSSTYIIGNIYEN